MKLRGTLRRSDLEGGVWVFEAEDGERYSLQGLASELEVAGARLEVEGKIDRQAMGFAMVGPVFEVRSARRL
jgi:hypothetical protein